MHTCLAVVYNHYFPSNIQRIEKLYKEKFTQILHLLPFADRTNHAEVSVGRSSHHFQGYIYDSLDSLLATGCDRFLFIADDLLLNPGVTESTVDQFFGLENEQDSFLHQFESLETLDSYWSHSAKALAFAQSTAGLSLGHALPERVEAERVLRGHGVFSAKVPRKALYKTRTHELYQKVQAIAGRADQRIRRVLGIPPVEADLLVGRRLAYPLAYGYSDICVVSRKNLVSFADYCGAFAAAGLFVEIALPTALALSSKVIRTQRDSPLSGGPLWGRDVIALDKYDKRLSALVQDFPRDWLFVHPVKLSEWTDD